MNKEELNRIIELLENSNSKEEAYFAIQEYGGGPNESFIKANKDGLELYAAQLLKASLNSDEIINDEIKNLIPLEYEEGWVEGEIFIHYVEPIDGKEIDNEKEKYKETFIDKLIPIGCITILLVIIVSAIVGVVSIFKWLF